MGPLIVMVDTAKVNKWTHLYFMAGAANINEWALLFLIAGAGNKSEWAHVLYGRHCQYT
jgi:hypothetical protein